MRTAWQPSLPGDLGRMCAGGARGATRAIAVIGILNLMCSNFFMNSELPNRKHPVHLSNFERPNRPVIIFLTVCTQGRRPILAHAPMVDFLVKAWRVAQHWRVGKFIVMPDHVHLFCSPAKRDVESVRDWAAFWKSLVSRGIQGHGPLGELGVIRIAKVEGCAATASLWQRDVWDTQLRSGQEYHEKWDYVRMNPVRKGLVNSAEDWPFQGELNVVQW